jgi:hypothetical protein
MDSCLIFAIRAYSSSLQNFFNLCVVYLMCERKKLELRNWNFFNLGRIQFSGCLDACVGDFLA